MAYFQLLAFLMIFTFYDMCMNAQWSNTLSNKKFARLRLTRLLRPPPPMLVQLRRLLNQQAC